MKTRTRRPWHYALIIWTFVPFKGIYYPRRSTGQRRQPGQREGMEARNSQLAIKLLPSMTDFAFLMPILYLFGRMGGMQTLLSDCDTGWHIKTGQWIARSRMVPMRDLFSYSKPDGIWY